MSAPPSLALEEPPVRGQADVHPLLPATLGPDSLGTLLEAGAALWDSRDSLVVAWQLLTRTVCDHCELGHLGLHDDALPSRLLCARRLETLRPDTRRAFVPADVRDLRLLRQRSATGLAELGRIPYPFVARKGDRGFTRIGWDEALETAGEALAALAPERIGVLTGPRGLSNEALYAQVRAARLLGISNLDVCTTPGAAQTREVLAEHLGHGAATCSLADLVGAELILLVGTHVHRDQPSLARVLRKARAQGARVVALNAQADLSDADDAFTVREPAALLGAAVTLLHGSDGLDTPWLAEHVTSWRKGLKAWTDTPVQTWLDQAGARREHAEWLATLLGRASRIVSLVGPDPKAAEALVALHLGRGAVGRPNTGLVPLGAGPAFQGARDCGVHPSQLPGGGRATKKALAALETLWGGQIPATQGLGASAQLTAAERGELNALWLLGADPLTAFGATAEPALARAPLRLHLATHLDPSMLVDPAGTVLVLPLETLHEQAGGATVTSVERRVRYSPQLTRRQAPGLARPQWQVPGQLAQAADPALGPRFEDLTPAALRRELAQANPAYEGLGTLRQPGDWIQWGGPQLHREGRFPLARDKARLPAPG